MFTLLTLTTLLATTALGSPIAQQQQQQQQQQQHQPAAPNTPAVATPTPGFNTTTTTTLFCGAHRYTPTAYVCYNNTTLCPIQNGVALQACGQQCYDAKIYACSGGSLQLSNGTVAAAGVWPPAGATPTGTPAAVAGWTGMQ
ncbi:Carbohydrate binding septum localised [Macrophomina phaseolina MS6]|uniref:Carbohydrate binding septum localised n=1 Tax=Macrophomina phaseolina (strain MS6) TaxID=1126212 RepID=K2RL75_MACPH|nr:Carbohydrate binding septum localised [Macrophomina phaseolina MS6]